ncbi:MAG: hypothetical protein KDN19_03380 [Verrucomicrobiae bacterium]|nr:hypothetical protein [Verrucomicrobiae bacterium]
MSFRRSVFPLLLALLVAALVGIAFWAMDETRPPVPIVSGPDPVPPKSVTFAPDRSTKVRPKTLSPASADPVAESPDAIEDFAQWVSDWRGQKDAQTLETGLRLARERRVALYDLIATDPKAALDATIDFPVRSRLPTAIANLLETPVDGRGDLELLAAAPLPGGPPPPRATWRVATIGRESWDAFVYGRREAQQTKLDLPLSGIALDDRIAIRESPLRRLQPSEPIPPGVKPPEPMFLGEHVNNPPVASENAPLYVLGDRVLRVCCAAHAGQIEAELRAAEAGPGPWVGASGGSGSTNGAEPATGASSWTEGPKTVLVIRLEFSDVLGTPNNGSGTTFTPTYLADQINTEAQSFYDEVSYGKTSLSLNTADVTAVLEMPKTAQYYAVNNKTTELRIDAISAAESAGFDTSSYDRIFGVFSDLGTSRFASSQFTFGGLGQIGAPFMWMNGSFSGPLVNHELGHTYGLNHASLWDIPGGSSDPVDPAGTTGEYGDVFDRMGGSPGDSPLHPGHFNPWFLNRLDWMPDAAIQEVTTGGTYRIYRFDHANADLGSTLALKIGRESNRDYWIGYRRKYAGHPTHGDMGSGAYVMWGYKTAQNSHLIDIDTPGSDARDASLNVGNTFDDPAAGIHMTATAAGGSGAGEWLDVTVAFDSRIRFTSSVLDVDEQAGVATLRLSRGGSTSGSVTAIYQTVNGTATSPADFASKSGAVTWTDGDGADKTINVSIVGDGTTEGAETFTLELISITGGVIVDGNVATINIVEPGAADSNFTHEWFNQSGSIHDFVIQPDGKIAFAGRAGNLGASTLDGIGRLETDGSEDTDFTAEGDGADITPVNAIERQPDGKLIVGGSFTSIRGVARNRLARLTPEGALDPSFDPGAGPNGTVNDIAIQPDGKILITGDFDQYDGVNRLAIARLNRDGSLDTTFLATPLSGANSNSVGYVLALQPDGKVLIGGLLYTSYQAFFPGGFASGIWRLDSDGTLDTSFDVGVGAHVDGDFSQLQFVYALAVQPDGKVMVGGTFTGFRNQTAPHIVRLNSNGTMDSTFLSNIGSGANGSVDNILVQNDGRIVIGGRFTSFAGNSRNYAARLFASGSFDSTFNANLTIADFDAVPVFSNSVRHFGLQTDGKLLIAQDLYGQDQDAIARVFTGIASLPGVLELSAGSFIGTEGDTVSIPVTRTGGSGGAVQVAYATYPNTATEGSDYPLSTGVLNWADGDDADKMITIALTDDGIVEPDETFTIQLGTPVGGILLGETADALVTIADSAATTIDPTSKTVTSAAQNYNIDVTSTTSWSVSESLDWASVSPASGTGNDTLTVTVDENLLTSVREGPITIGGQQHWLTQEAAPAFTNLSPTSKTIDSSSQAYQITIDSNTSWSVVESLPWASVSPTSGSGDDVVTVTVLANSTTTSRNGTITIGGETHDLTQQGAPPSTAITPTTKTVTSTSQPYSISVVSNTSWSVTESLDWVSVSPTSGSGNALLTVTVSANPDTTQRNGDIDIGGQTHSLTQQAAPPTTSIAPTSKTVSTAAQSYDITVTSNTSWSVSESLSWASVSPTSGTGNDTVTVSVTENTIVASRNGNLDIGGQTHSLTQQGVPPVTTIDPTTKNVDETAQTYTIDVTSNTSWTVSESLAWASVSPTSGTGNDTLTVTIAENTSTSSRNGTLTIGTESHALTQDGAPPQTSIDLASKNVDATAQSYQIQVTSNTNWSVTESLDFVTVTPPSGNGNDTVTVTVAENTSTNSRGGDLDIGGQTHSLTQDGVPPVFDLDPPENQVGPGGTTYTIELSSNTNWTVSESIPWASVSPSSGTGDTTLTVTVDANPDITSRMGDIDVGSATHQLTQLGVPAYLDVLPASRGLDASAQAYTFDLSSNAPWTITESLDWITVSPTSGTGDDVVTVTVSENTDPEARAGVLQIGGETHTVSQSGTLEAVLLTPAFEAASPSTNPIAWDDTLTGVYDGILRDAADGHTLIGAVHRLVISPPRPAIGPGGFASATLFFNGRRAVIRGAFDGNGRLLLDLDQRDGSVVSVDLQLEGTGTASEERLVGTIEWDGLIANADLPRAPFHPRLNPLPTPDQDPVNGVANVFTMILPSDPGWTSQEPGGNGWASVRVNAGGVVTLRGALGDGTRFADSAYLSAVHSFDLFTEIYRPVAGLGRGRCGGRLVLRDQAGVSDFDGLFQWKKHPDTRERRYPDGFDLETWALGSVFEMPVPGSPVLSTLAMQEFNAALAIRGPELPNAGAPIDKVVTWRINDAISYYGPERIAARVNRRFGLLNGNYFDPATRTRFSLFGVAYQKQEFTAGQYGLGTGGGGFQVQPGTAFPYPGSEAAGVLTRIDLPGAPAGLPATSAVGSFDTDAAGIYGGLVDVHASGDHEGGLLNFRVAPSGAFSGQIWIGRDRYVFRGAFDDATGTAQVPVPLGGSAVALLDLTLEQIDGADPGTGFQLSGTIRVDGVDYQVAAEQRPGTTTKNGAYTLIIRSPDGADPDLEPAGDGYGVLTVTPTGICRGSVVLADGFRTALSGHLSTADEWSLYRPLYAGRRGFLSGKMTFRHQDDLGDLDGEVRWVRQNDAPPATVYPAGFDTTRGVIGSLYQRPGPGERAIEGLTDDFHNAWLRLSGPDFSGDAGLGLTEIDRAITWATNHRLTYYGPERVILRFNFRNGLLTGRYLDRPNGVNASLGGVLLQEQDLVSGSAITGAVSGLLGIEPR